MANIGMTKANVYADLAVSRFSKSVNKSTQVISANQTNSTNGNQSSRVGMTDTLRLDIAGKSAAIKSMAVSQSYLATTISVLDNASDMLARIYELAVLAANSSNTAADNVAIDIETERLSDRFHAIMSSTQFKGKEIFQEIPNSLVMAADGNGSSIEFGAGSVDYDAVYDYTNPGVQTTQPGIKYEVKKHLTNEEKDAIIAQTTGITRDELVVGFQFTTLGAQAPAGPGVVTSDLYYLDGDGTVDFDPESTVTSDEKFNGGYLELKFTSNGEISDDFTFVAGDGSAGTFTINGAIITYVDPVHGAIEVGEIQSNGQDGSDLKINLYEDASIPGTSNLLNGDFSNGNANWNLYNKRVDFGSTFTVNGLTIPTPTDAEMVQPIHGSPPNNDNATSNINSGSLSTAGGALNLDTGGMTIDSYGIYHGPAAVSDAFAAKKGDYLKFDFNANGTGDDYHVAGYLVNTADNSITIAINDTDLINPPELNSTGKRINGSTSVVVPDDGNYHFVFITGTYDKTGGTVAGADMTIDNIRAENPYDITNEIVQKMLRSVKYSSSSTDQKTVKDVQIKLNNKDDVVSLTDTSKIFNSEFNGKIMLAPSKDLENAVSLGGSQRANLVTYNIEVAQERINKARVYAASKYAVLESAIEATTDLRSQFEQTTGKLSDINFSLEAAHFTKNQMLEKAAAAILAQANKNQEGLLLLV